MKYASDEFIAAFLSRQGYDFEQQHEIGCSIYGTPLYADFFINPTDRYPLGLAVEIKRQSVRGSADHKFPWLALNIQQCYPCPAVIVLSGTGASFRSRQWLKAQIDNRKLLAVYTLEEFFVWARNNQNLRQMSLIMPKLKTRHERS